MPRPRPILSLLERSLALLQQRQRPGTALNAKQQRGLIGERAACFHLRREGYIVVARRWTSVHVHGEVDLIAWEGETLCFIEVKTRDSRAPFAAEFAVDRHKQETLQHMAEAYIRQLPWSAGQPPALRPRFDVVSVYEGADGEADIRLLRDCFRA